MLQLFRSSSTPMFGMDISSTSVKLLELSQSGDSFRVESYAVAPLPPGVVVEKAIKDPDVLAETISKAVKQSKTSNKTAAIAVPDSSVMTKVVQMDKALTEDEIETQLIADADKYIPYPLDEVRMDFDVLHPSANNPELVDVLLVASRSENVELRVSTLAEAGLNLKLVDVESYAMERAVSLIAQDLPNKGIDEAIAVVDIGSIMTSLTILYNLQTIFTREEVFGGEQLTKAIQRHYGLTYAEAGQAKKEGGLPDDYASEVLAHFKESAVLQVRRALQFFFSSSQHNKVSHIVLAGGTAMIPGLAELIEEQIGIPVSVANPFYNMTVSKRVNLPALTRDASALMICCGLAMRSFE